jgi:hypothetical protein
LAAWCSLTTEEGSDVRGPTISSVPVLIVLTLCAMPRSSGAFEVEVLRGSTVSVVQGTPGGKITEVTRREDPTPPPPPVPEAAPEPEPGPAVVVNILGGGGYDNSAFLGVGFPVFFDPRFRHHGFFPNHGGRHPGAPSHHPGGHRWGAGLPPTMSGGHMARGVGWSGR